MSFPKEHLVLANGAEKDLTQGSPIILDYRPNSRCTNKISTNFDSFIKGVYHLPDRIHDLLEIAVYIFGMDRIIPRGPIDSVEYHSWSRKIRFVQKVRDYDFWSDSVVKKCLAELLEFMLGDYQIQFEFEAGHTTERVDLFDQDKFLFENNDESYEIALFSGGLDSLAGALHLLTNFNEKIILASHQSNNTIKKTQRELVEYLNHHYSNRISHYKFLCNLVGNRAIDETQRSRSFLFTSIAFSLAATFSKDHFFIFENGVTSLNFRRREDLANSRASRTTHPQTVHKLESLFSLILEKPFRVDHPFLFETKSDIVSKISKNHAEIIASSVSCTGTSFLKNNKTHCGECFQCIDRRIAAFTNKVTNFDHKGLYNFDITSEQLKSRTKTIAIDYIRQARYVSESSPDSFYEEYLSEMANVIEYLPITGDDLEKAESIYDLYSRHSKNVKLGLQNIQQLYDDIFESPPIKNSLLNIIAEREYLKPVQERLVVDISKIIEAPISSMFSTNKPKDENDLNDKIGAVLRSHNEKIRSEYPTTSFALAKNIPDHTLDGSQLLIETKFIRNKSTPSVITEGIAADLTKYPPNKFILFIVYDPYHRIKNDKIFVDDFENRGRNKILIIR